MEMHNNRINQICQCPVEEKGLYAIHSGLIKFRQTGYAGVITSPGTI